MAQPGAAACIAVMVVAVLPLMEPRGLLVLACVYFFGLRAPCMLGSMAHVHQAFVALPVTHIGLA